MFNYIHIISTIEFYWFYKCNSIKLYNYLVRRINSLNSYAY